MSKFILIWYLDDDSDTRLQLLDADEEDINKFMQDYGKRSGVKNIIEGYTVTEIHEVVENTWTEGFTVNTVDLRKHGDDSD